MLIFENRSGTKGVLAVSSRGHGGKRYFSIFSRSIDKMTDWSVVVALSKMINGILMEKFPFFLKITCRVVVNRCTRIVFRKPADSVLRDSSVREESAELIIGIMIECPTVCAYVPPLAVCTLHVCIGYNRE